MHSSAALHGVPPSDACVVRHLLERHLRERPAQLFARFASGAPDWSYADLHREVAAAAHALRRSGVEQGELVLCWLPNGPLAIRTWLALNCLGAIYVPLNPAFQGTILEHTIRLTGARTLVVHPSMAEGIPASVLPQLQRRLVLAADPLPDGGGALPPLARPIEPWDSPAVIFTSGTTGPSKAVLTSYAHLWATVSHTPCPLGPADRYLQYLPLFHIAGMSPIYQALVAGSSIAVIEQFRTGTFWADVLRTGATDASVMGTVAAFLLDQGVGEAERATPLKRLLLSPLTHETLALARRIGARWYTWFNMTEVSRPLMSGMDPDKPGSCGRPRRGIQARLVDEHDCEVPPGSAGELVLRADTPWSMNSGYLNDPEATARAWRNGWFHTGDVFRVDAEGDHFFVDRRKDTIRRRGENISSFEVEHEVLAFPGVKACAAVGVPSALGDQEVLVVLEPQQGARIEPGELLGFLLPRMAHFMVPRYVRVVDALPRTPTHRVRKDVLRVEGLAPGTWDREAAGIFVRRRVPDAGR